MKLKKLLAAILVAVLALTVVPLSAFAADDNTPGSYYVTVINNRGSYYSGNYMSGGLYAISTDPTGFTHWSSDAGYDIFQNSTSYSTYFTMPAKSITITAHYTEVKHTVTVVSAAGGYAATDVRTAAKGDIITLTASPYGDGYNYLNNYNYYYNGYYYQYYVFSGWRFSQTVTFVSGYSATSATTKFYMPDYDVTVQPVFTVSSYYDYYTPAEAPTTFKDGTAQASINTSSGVVTPGVNASGTLNSKTTVQAIKAVIDRRLVSSVITIDLPQGTTAVSKSAMQKLLNAAGNYDLKFKINSPYGTITVPVSSVRQLNTGISGNNAVIRASVSIFQRTYGNRDIAAMQTTQRTTYGAVATYRINADAVGIGADYGDRVYVVIFNPITKKLVRKTVTVNSSGQIAFTSSYSGVILFSLTPFTK